MNNRLVVYQSKNMASNAASVEQTKNMCSAFSKLFKEVNLYSNWYGVDSINISNYDTFNLAKSYLPGNSPIIKRIIFLFRYSRYRESTDLIFSRDLPVCVILTLMGHNVIWENHRFLSKRRCFTLVLLQTIKYFQKKFVVINTSVVVQRYFNIFLSNINSKYINHGVSNDILGINVPRPDFKKCSLPKRYIIYWGGVSDVKGIRELLEWYSTINGGKVVDLLIVGTKENFVDPKMTNITFLKRMEHRCLHKYIQNAELAIICSKLEYLRSKGAVPLKLFEAISLNKKILIFEDSLKYEIPQHCRSHCFLSSEITTASDLNNVINLKLSNRLFQGHLSYDSRAKRMLEAIKCDKVKY